MCVTVLIVLIELAKFVILVEMTLEFIAIFSMEEFSLITL